MAAYGGFVPITGAIDLATGASSLSLPADYHQLHFAFTALSFKAPENVQFQYRLPGFDDHWTDVGQQRSVTFPRLTPSDYRFAVRATSGDSLWSENEVSVAFTVVPAFWQTGWFRSAAAIALMATTLLIARYAWFRRLRRRLAALEQRAALDRERARIARDIHDDLGCGLTKIALLSQLSLQEMNGSAEAGGHVHQIAAAAKQQIKSLDETVWAINPRNDTLADLIGYIGDFMVESLRDTGIECHLDLPIDPPDVPLPSEVRHSLFLAVKEAINNVLRHSRARDVSLAIDVANSLLTIVIADNGLGFAAGPTQIGQDGLRNMRQRMSDIGGTFELSTVRGAGTRVVLGYKLSNVTNVLK
jgi:signal transduction histidine kinase